MPAAIDVSPQKWTNLRVLFDNGVYSVVAGEYEDERALGQRWNGEEGESGYPTQGSNPLWHVVPGFLAVPVLYAVLHELAAQPDEGNVQAVLDELAARPQATP